MSGFYSKTNDLISVLTILTMLDHLFYFILLLRDWSGKGFFYTAYIVTFLLVALLAEIIPGIRAPLPEPK